MSERPSEERAGMLRSMPALMRERPQWLLWRFEQYEGDKKPRKVPYYASGRKRKGEQGSVEDRAALVHFEPALAELERGRFDGLGFAFLPGDGLIGIDIDGAIDAESGEVSARCQAIIDACGSYTEYSPSGRGVHIIVQGETRTFKDNSIGLEVFCGRQFFTCTGRAWPGSVATVEQLPSKVLARLQLTVKGAKAQPKPAPAAPMSTGDDLQQRLEGALGVLHADMGYDEWLHVGMGLKAGLGDAGLRLWDYWSSKGSKYPGSEVLAQKWASFTSSGVSEATVFKMAMSAGWKPPKRPRPPSPSPSPQKAAPRARGEAPPAQPADGLSTPCGDSVTEMEDAGDGGPPDPDWREKLLRARGGPVDCRENVYTCLLHHPRLQGLVGYDEFSHRVMKLRPAPWQTLAGEWTTTDDYMLGLFLATHEHLMIKGEGTLVAGVAMAAFHNRYHPVLAYLDALPPWDGVERLAHWLHETLGAEDSNYTRLVGTWFPMGMVRRIRDPGCQMDYMVVLEGLQGKRKSTALRTLVGHDDWFADTPIRIGDKDAMLSLAGKWLVEMGEMDSFNKAEVTAVKQYITSRIDRVREPFARRFADRPRSCAFAGTTNQSEYFKDPTGARRFWPVACESAIDLEKLALWRDQLFAEAMHRLAHEDPEMRRCWPTREEEETYLVPQQEKREIVDPWFERLAQWLDSSANYGESGLSVREVDSFTSQDLLTKCLMVPMDRIDGGRQMATRIGIAMHKLKWEKRRAEKAPRLYSYWRPGARKAGEGVDGAAGGPAAEGEVLDEF